MTNTTIHIEQTAHGYAVLMRLPDRSLRLTVAQEATAFVEGEMGRLPVIEHRIPADFPMDPREALDLLVDILSEEIEKEGGEG